VDRPHLVAQRVFLMRHLRSWQCHCPIWGADDNPVQSNCSTRHHIFFYTLHVSSRAARGGLTGMRTLSMWFAVAGTRAGAWPLGSVEESSLHDPTEDVVQTALGEMEGSLLLLVLNVDAGRVFHQHLGCLHAVLIARQVADKRKLFCFIFNVLSTNSPLYLY